MTNNQTKYWKLTAIKSVFNIFIRNALSSHIVQSQSFADFEK